MTTESLPSTPAFQASRFGLRANSAAFASPLTQTVQTQSFLGDRWYASYTLPPMLRAKAEPWLMLLAKLGGRAGRFYGYDPDAKTPRGTWAGTVLVNGGSQTGTSLILDGFTAGATVKIGDYFEVNGELKKITADGTADGSGNLTVSFTPSLRASPADNAAVTSTNPTCTMMLIDDDQASWDADELGVYRISFQAVEVFA